MVKWLTFALVLTLIGMDAGARIAYHAMSHNVTVATGGIRR